VGNPELVPALEWVAIGLLIVLFLWFRPNGILPERRRILSGAKNAPVPVMTTSDDESDALIKIGNVDQLNFRELLRLGDPVNDNRVILSTTGLTKTFNDVTVVRT